MEDTIVAVSTARGSAARATVRLAGPRAFALFAGLVADRSIAAGTTRLAGPRRAFIPIDRFGTPAPCDAWCFVGPRSFTGGDLVELHLPGSALLVDLVVRRLCAAGARPAHPGEFTRRAVMAGKLDLTRAEATAALIRARDENEHRRAKALLDGGLARAIATIEDRVVALLVPLELALDFSDQDVTIVEPDSHAARLAELADEVRRLGDASQATPHRHLPRIVLRGPANAGKSSLFNALLGRPAAIATPIRGTTRDVVAAEWNGVAGGAWLVDTAGDDVFGGPLDDLAHAARERALLEADLVLEVRDLRAAVWPASADVPFLRVGTMLDLLPDGSRPPPGIVAVSNRTGEGLQALGRAISGVFERGEGRTEPFLVTDRHAVHLQAASAAISRAASVLGTAPPEFAAADLRDALREIRRITGASGEDPVLDRIFRDFCIGK